jgi:hypothetical protein
MRAVLAIQGNTKDGISSQPENRGRARNRIVRLSAGDYGESRGCRPSFRRLERLSRCKQRGEISKAPPGTIVPPASRG